MRDVDILGSYWTLAGGAYPHTDHEYSVFDFKDRVEAAAKVGFKGIGIWHADLEHTLKTRSLKEMKQILDDNGIVHLELEFLTDWFLDDHERRRKSDQTRNLLMEAAEALGARHIKVGDFFNEPCPMDKLIEEYATLCREAAERGTGILYEFMPFSNINSLDDVLALCRGTGAKNGGFIFDLWHVIMLGITYEEIEQKLNPDDLFGVELNDGPLTVPDDLHDATVNHRQLCGEGQFNIHGFIALLDKFGYDGPYGIEVLNAELRERPLDEIMRRAYDTTIAQFRD
jgi:sugar phosphate isomerase/epimerase